MEFAHAEDERMRLDNTICGWKGKPALITKSLEDNEDGHVFARRLGGRKEYDVEINELDVRAPRLGYYRRDKDYPVYWLVRRPLRQYKAGLPIMSATILMVDPSGRRGHRDRFPTGWFINTAMRDCLVGLDYSIPEAFDMMVAIDGNSSAIINRNFILYRCDQRYTELHFMGRPIGHAFPDGRITVWEAPDASFLAREINKIKGIR